MKLIRRVSLVAFATLAAGIAAAQNAAPSITILPVMNTSGEKWEELKTKLTERTSDQLYKVFRDRGFKIAEPGTVKAKLDELKIDLTDEENHRKDNFYKVAEGLGTDYVVFFVVTNNTQRTKNNLFSSVREGEVTVKYWLLDVKKHEPIFSAKSETAKARPHADFGVATKGSDQQLTAADRAVPAALKDFLKLYPETKGGGK